jgi:hypothetical protein
LPEALQRLPDDPNFTEVRKSIPGRPLSPEAAPTVFVSTRPAEIILTDGPPAFTTIPGTQVQLVTNGNGGLFRHQGDGRFFYLVSGRWFSAASLEGPWSFATNDLPPDFSMIPPDSAAGNVLASVPGTSQAQEAVLQAQIPRQATLKRDDTTLQVTYVGQPDFEPIPGTGLRYAVNSPFEVIEVGGGFYCCHQGAWFVAASPAGPWALADSVPPGIHRIPPSHPLHNVTYVNVYAVTPATVTYGYTMGYLGGLVSAGVLVYGTGYAYPPIVLPGPVPVYMPYPRSYAGNVWYNPATGSWARGGTVYGPYGGAATGGTAYNPATGAWARGGAVYGPNGGAGAFSAYNPTTGAYARGGSSWGPAGGWANASFANPTTGWFGSTTQNWNPYGRWGSSELTGPNQTVRTESGSNAWGSAGAFSSSTGAEGAGVRGAGGNNAGAVRTQGGNVYAGADGNVYRKTDDGWQKYNNGSWQQAQPRSNNTASGTATPQQNGSGSTRGSAAAQPAATQGRPESQRKTSSADGVQSPGRQVGQQAGQGSEGRNFNQLENDHQARQYGEMRQRNFSSGGGWGNLEGGLHGFGEGRLGGGFGGFHRR